MTSENGQIPAVAETDVKSEVEAARMRISKAAGVPLSAVRISIDFFAEASTYQPIAAHGYGPQQAEEMRRYAEKLRNEKQ